MKLLFDQNLSFKLCQAFSSMPIPPPDPFNNPQAVFNSITALANTSPPDWRAIARFLTAPGWKLDRPGRLPDVIARKQFRPGPKIAAFVPQALYIEMGFSVGFTAAANIIHARQGAASTLIPPPSDPSGN